MGRYFFIYIIYTSSPSPTRGGGTSCLPLLTLGEDRGDVKLDSFQLQPPGLICPGFEKDYTKTPPRNCDSNFNLSSYRNTISFEWCFVFWLYPDFSCSIINLKGVPPDVQEIVVARLTKELFDARKAGLIPPFMYIVEEAHNYCPERGFGNAISSQILRTVASEGRKFGMGLCVVSQRPAKVDKNVISQCNTHLILKVTNPNDVRAIIQSVEGLTTDTADEIQRLQVGVALVSGGSLAKPVMVEIRVRETDHGGRSAKIIAGEEIPIDFRATKMKREELPQIPAPAMTGSAQQVKKEKPKKAEIVHRVANRLGWVSTDDPNETISILSKEAKKMGEDPFKYLHTLAKLGEKFCKEENPNCIKCPMRDRCRYRLTRVSEIL